MATFDFRNMLRFLHCIIKKYSKNVPRTFRKPEDRKSDRRYATPRKMKFSIKDFFSKCDQICTFLRIWSHLLKRF